MSDARYEYERAYIKGLRDLAAMFTARPDLIPKGRGIDLRIFSWEHYNDQEAVARGFAAALPRPVAKEAMGDAFTLKSDFGPHSFAVSFNRELVCTRTVLGSREITEMVPDPDAEDSRPMVTVTRTEEIVEWKCPPALLVKDGGES